MTHTVGTGCLVRRLGAVILVDALGPPYFHNGHLPDAVNIPPHQVLQRAERLLPDRNAAIVVYGNDAHSSNARIVLEKLAQLGYTNLLLYLDGIEGWAGAGLPVEPTYSDADPAL